MLKTVSKKDKEFMKKFVRLYFKRHELDLFLEKNKKSVRYKNKIKKLDQKIQKFLPKYSILFDNDLTILYNIFTKIAKEEKVTFIINDFKSFLIWVLGGLYKEKIINKKSYEILNHRIAKLNFSISLLGSVLWKEI
jgi:hypothetical protein